MAIMALTSSNEAQHLPSPAHESSAVAATIPRLGGDTQMCEAEMPKARANAAPSDPKLQEYGSEISNPKIVLKLKGREKTEAEEAVSKMMTGQKEEALVLPGLRKPNKRKRTEAVRWFKVPTGLTNEEMNTDLWQIFESKPAQQLSRRPREVKAGLDGITPGPWLRSARISMK